MTTLYCKYLQLWYRCYMFPFPQSFLYSSFKFYLCSFSCSTFTALLTQICRKFKFEFFTAHGCQHDGQKAKENSTQVEPVNFTVKICIFVSLTSNELQNLLLKHVKDFSYEDIRGFFKVSQGQLCRQISLYFLIEFSKLFLFLD